MIERNPRGFTVLGIDHVALEVADVAASAAWYRDLLGLERRHAETWGDLPTMMCAGTTCVALFPRRAGAAPGSPSARPALRHLAFRVDGANFARAQAELDRRGIAFVFQDHELTHSIYFADPDGYELELTTPAIGPSAGA